ncbi:MAG: hypothetical protein IJA48_02625, partial [Oscillospiraceae bacterium]|nr:hypothetical protein [Oscillospiraceae bacterium]
MEYHKRKLLSSRIIHRKGTRSHDKQKFAELFDADAIYTVGRGLAPAGGRNSLICTALRRIRAMLQDFSSAPV